jgi:hypothetical protein
MSNTTVPPGSTIDPKTGKIYRLKPPKKRSAEYQAREAAVITAKSAQAEYMKSKGYMHDPRVKGTVHHIGGQWVLIPPDPEMDRCLARTRAAQVELKEYKRTHRSEFRNDDIPGIPVLRDPK